MIGLQNLNLVRNVICCHISHVECANQSIPALYASARHILSNSVTRVLSGWSDKDLWYSVRAVKKSPFMWWMYPIELNTVARLWRLPAIVRHTSKRSKAASYCLKKKKVRSECKAETWFEMLEQTEDIEENEQGCCWQVLQLKGLSVSLTMKLLFQRKHERRKTPCSGKQWHHTHWIPEGRYHKAHVQISDNAWRLFCLPWLTSLDRDTNTTHGSLNNISSLSDMMQLLGHVHRRQQIRCQTSAMHAQMLNPNSSPYCSW